MFSADDDAQIVGSPLGAHIHHTALIDAPCQIGACSEVGPFSHVMANSVIGDHSYVGHHTIVSGGVMLGSYVRVMNNVTLPAGIIIENHAKIGHNTIFASLRHLRAAAAGSMGTLAPTLIRAFASIGPNCSVGQGLTIGRYSFIEAGSTIDCAVPDYAIAYGHPLQLAGWRCVCGEPLEKVPARQGAHVGCTCKRVYRLETEPMLQLVLEPDAETASA